MKAILIDDEMDSLESLQHELKTYCPEVSIAGTYSDPREGLKAILSIEPDLLFLDIEMPHLNGFELLESLPSIEFDVIFVTAYDEFAVRAFKFNAIDYLLKPVMKAKLIQAVQRVRERQHARMTEQDLKALITNTRLQTRGGLENIALPTSEGFEFIHVNDIVYLQSESNYTWVHLANGTKHLLAKTLKEMSSMISFSQFFRAHQSYFVNLNHAKRYVRGQGGYLVLKDGTQIPVSRAHREELIALLKM